jgi:malate dehydrogenase (oxaloacetate-decarboxylating)(NADP+)
MKAYRRQLSTRRDPTAAMLDLTYEDVRNNPPRRVVFAEGEEEKVIRAAIAFRNSGYGTPVLVGRSERIEAATKAIGLNKIAELEIHNARLSQDNKRYTDFLHARLQRQGYLWRDCQRLVNQDRNVFAALMVACGDADAMVTGVTRSYHVALDDVTRVLAPEPGKRVMGLSIMMARGQTVFMADTTVHERPTPAQLADIAMQTAAKARALGHEPRVAFLSFSNFGNPMRELVQTVRDAVTELNRRQVDFEYDGDMTVDVALDQHLMRTLYPFCRLSGPANVLIMPGLHSANIASQLLQKLGGGTLIGPLLVGLSKPAQIVQLGGSVGDLVNMAVLAAHDANIAARK